MVRRIAATMGCLAAISTILLILLWNIYPFPEERLSRFAASPLVLDREGGILWRSVSPQEQWCLPVRLSDIHPRVMEATIVVEDQRYDSHPGVDILALSRAMAKNLARRRIVSGASTIPMQVCRMMDNRPRTVKSKLVEMFRAVQLSRIRDKDQILELYLNMAPYGGNIRGVGAASQFYFSKHPRDLTLAESALLAGLPKSPTRYDPRRHFTAAMERSHHVLERMVECGRIDEDELREAVAHPAILNPMRASARAAHAAVMALGRRPAGGRTTIDPGIQTQVETLAMDQRATLPDESELAAVVIEIGTGSIVAMVGSADYSDPRDGQVNAALALRSPGSALKPFVYAAAFQDRRLAMDSIVYDIPIDLDGWEPSNFDRTYSGSMTAATALRQSLNIPALYIARETGLGRCFGIVESAGIRLPVDVNRRAGLSLVVGGIETTLVDLTNAYAMFGREGRYRKNRLFVDELCDEGRTVLDTNVCATINEILSCRKRTVHGMEGGDTERLAWFMWKTGTSSGRRDAWAVGHNLRYAAGVWVGRFRGTGRLDYVGAEAAEPLLARMFCLPAIKNESEPAPPQPITVTRPLPKPANLAERFVIVSPENGRTYLALEGTVRLSLKASGPEPLNWFMNDRLMEAGTESVELSRGTYRLVCVGREGISAKALFTVR